MMEILGESHLNIVQIALTDNNDFRNSTSEVFK